MFICTVCNGNKFSKEEGLYYCITCYTQVEGWREEDAEFAHAFGAGQYKTLSRDVSKHIEENLEEAEVETANDEFWTTWEAMNHILAKQVSQMEALPGVAPNFRFMVFSIWTHFLHKKGYAFLEDRRKIPLKVAATERDYCSLMLKKLVNRKRRRSESKASRASSRMSSTSGEYNRSQSIITSKLKVQLATQQYIETESVSIMDKSDVSDVSTYASSRTSLESELPKNNARMSKQKIWNRKKLVGVLYLGLLLSNSEAQLIDLLRWITEGHVSYQMVKNLLPRSFQLTAEDEKIFCTCNFTPTVVEIQEMATDLCITCGIYQLPTPDIVTLAKRFIKELDLPELFGELVHKLILTFPLDDNFYIYMSTGFFNIESRAIAYVIVLLKMLYVLDDNTEKCISSDAEHSNKNAFIWTKWVELTEARKSILSYFFGWAKQKYSTTSLHTAGHIYTKYFVKDTKNDIVLGEFARKSLKNELDWLMGDEFDKNNMLINTPKTLFPMTDGMELVRTYLQDKGYVLNSNLDYDFSKQELHHDFIPEQHTFEAFKNLKIIKLAPNRIRNNGQPYCRKTIDSNINLSIRMKNKNLPNSDDAYSGKNRRSLYWFLDLHMNSYGKFNVEDEMNHWPSSFLWLFELCASIVEDTPMNLCKQICMIEMSFGEKKL